MYLYILLIIMIVFFLSHFSHLLPGHAIVVHRCSCVTHKHSLPSRCPCSTEHSRSQPAWKK